MRIFLLWGRTGGAAEGLEPPRVATNLRRIFAPLFTPPREPRVLYAPGVAMVVLDLPVPGWRPLFFEEDDRTWVGQSQLFEFQSEGLWAVSNRMFAFKALGVSLEPAPEQWAVWATLGWFPLQMTGYKRIRFLEPATRLRWSAEGIRRTRYDVLSAWVQPPPAVAGGLSRASPGARCSSTSKDACRCGTSRRSASPAVGTAGRSCPSFRALDVDFSAVVRGLPGRHDAVMASELARIAGFRLQIEDSRGFPPEDARACRRSIAAALLWQAGHVAHHRHKTFLANWRCLTPTRVNVTGQNGEIGRRERAIFRDPQAQQVRARTLTETRYGRE